MQDLRHAARTLRRSPAFTVVAVITLALGIGATTAIWSVVHQVLLRDLPYPEPERLVVLWENDRLRGTEREAASFPDYEDLAAQSRSYAALAALQQQNRTLTGDGAEAERTLVVEVTPSYHDVLRVAPLLGRPLTAADAAPGAAPVVLLGSALWQSRYGGDPGVVGRSVRLDGVPHTVVGVMRTDHDLHGPDVQVWAPLAPDLPDTSHRGMHNTLVVGRLRDGVSRAEAQVEASAVMKRLEAAYPDDNEGRGAVVAALHSTLVGDSRGPLLTLLTAVIAVLLVACGNVASLLFARATTRERELAVRAALGGGRLRLVRLLLTESLLLGCAGGAAGVALAFWGIGALRSLAPDGVPGIARASLDPAVLLVSAIVSLASVLLSGLAPALRASAVDPERLAGSAARSGTPRRALRTRHLLVAIQGAVSVVLVLSSALLLRSFAEMRRVDPGYVPGGLATLRLELPAGSYPPPPDWPWLEFPRATQFQDALLERARAIPGVRSAALALNGPALGGWTTTVVAADRPAPPPSEREEAVYSPVSAGYFETLGVPLRRGRLLQAQDGPSSPRVVVVNEAFVRRWFPDQEPIGRRIRFFGVEHEVVGVVGDVRHRGLLAAATPTFYPSLAQNPQSQLSLVARAGSPQTAAGRAPAAASGGLDAAALEGALRAAVREIDPEVAVFGAARVADQVAGSIARERFTTLLLGVFAALALALAAIGVYGLVAYSLAQRTREIGIRIALGAGRGHLLRSAMGRGVAASAAGIGIGLAASPLAGRLLRSQLFGVAPYDPPTYAVVAAALLAAVLVAGYVPARRAARIPPTEALRQE